MRLNHITTRANQPYRSYTEASADERASAPAWARSSSQQKKQAQLGVGQDKSVYRGWWCGRDVALLFLRKVFVCVYVCVCLRVYMCVFVCVYWYIYVYVHVYKDAYACARAWERTGGHQTAPKAPNDGTQRQRCQSFAANRCLRLQQGSYEREAAIFQRLGRHPHLVAFHGLVHCAGQQMLVWDLAPLGSLDAAVQRHVVALRSDALRWKVLGLDVVSQVASGMARLAELRILHKYLALRNLMTVAFAPSQLEVHVRVSDFGLSKDASSDDAAAQSIESIALPVRWTAPEALNGSGFSDKSDVFSLGVLIWELLGFAQHTPHADAEDEAALARQLAEGTRTLSKPPGGDDEVWGVAEMCLRHSPASRPSFGDLCLDVRHKWRHFHALCEERQREQRQAREQAEAALLPALQENEVAQPVMLAGETAAQPAVLSISLDLEENPEQVFGTGPTLAGRDPRLAAAQDSAMSQPAVAKDAIMAIISCATPP